MTLDDHSTQSAERLHHFLRVLSVAVIFLYVGLNTAETGGMIWKYDPATLLFLIIGGIAAGAAIDWIMWYIAEFFVGEDGLFRKS